ncbi:MAG: hypothetical protein IKS47_04960 [Bacteroidales bacterium]|nr:hypothetical protein [Bacteroidales bacterium]
MDKDTSQLQRYQYFLSFFLPEGILDFFEPVWMETQALNSRESKKDILYGSSLHIYLDEWDNRP